MEWISVANIEVTSSTELAQNKFEPITHTEYSWVEHSLNKFMQNFTIKFMHDVSSLSVIIN